MHFGPHLGQHIGGPIPAERGLQNHLRFGTGGLDGLDQRHRVVDDMDLGQRPRRPRSCARSPTGGGAGRYPHTLCSREPSFVVTVLLWKARVCQHPEPHGERRTQPSSLLDHPQRTSQTNGGGPTHQPSPSRNSGDPLLHRITSGAAHPAGDPGQRGPLRVLIGRGVSGGGRTSGTRRAQSCDPSNLTTPTRPALPGA